jgi:hypothetical protein
MESRNRIIDTFQIVGFAVSTGVTIVLVVAQTDPMQSIVIGLILATLTELFDLQLRQSSSEARLLEANALSQVLYRDADLLGKVREMIYDYYFIENGWFDLFKRRAEDAVSECHRILRSIASGVMEPPPRSQFGLAVTSFELAHTSLKQVADFAAIKGTVEGYRGWYMKAWTEAAQRGVEMTMVLVVSNEEFKEMLAQTRSTAMPIGTHIALANELPPDMDENYLIVDDHVVSFLERRVDGTFKKETISIVPVEVERMVKRFDQVLRYARKAEDVFAGTDSPSAGPGSAVPAVIPPH